MSALGSSDPSARHDAIAERAASLFERRRFGGWSEADEAELAAWIAESFLHRAAWLRLEAAVTRAENLVALCPHEFGKEDGAAKRRRFPVRVFAISALMAASIALVATFGVPYVRSLLQPPDRNFSTDVGGRTLVKFADGTLIELNTDTAMRFRMTTAERTVWLDKGEAWFHVAHNPANPFAVIVGTHRVTDLGTEFFVRRGTEHMEIALLAGRAKLDTEGTPTTMLKPGDDAVATPVSVKVTRKTPQELADALAWRRGLLVFRKTRLSDAVREFNRYNTTRLVIADPSIAGIEITADLRTDDYDAFLNLARTVLNLRADREGNDILISRGQPSAKKTKAASAP